MLADEQSFDAEHDTLDGLENAIRRPSILVKARQGSLFKALSTGGRKRRASTVSTGHDPRTIPEEESDEEEAGERSALRKVRSREDGISANGHDDGRSSEIRRKASVAFDDDDQALSAMYDEGITLKRRAISLYVSLCELRSFIQLNRTGFAKVLKKYDKTCDRKLKSSYLKGSVECAYPFQESTMNHLTENIEKAERAYANVVTKGDMEKARQELRLHLREHVVWERNTVWREMIGIERKAQAANMGIRQTLLGNDHDPRKARLQGDDAEEATKEVHTPIGRYRCPKFLLSSSFYILVAIIAIFAVLLIVPIMDKPEQQNCLAMVVFVSLLWATEVCSGEIDGRNILTNLRRYRYS